MSDEKSKQAATIGSVVRVREHGENEEEVYRLANVTKPMDNQLAPDNPMGKALIGAAPGDQVTVRGPEGAIEFDVIEVRQEQAG